MSVIEVAEPFLPLYETKKHFAICRSGRTGGKTIAGRDFLMAKNQTCPKRDIIICRDSYSDIKDSIFSAIEKYIYKNIVEKKNKPIFDLLSDKYFTVKSLSELVAEYHNRYDASTKHPDKKFYFKLRKDLEDRRISEEYFITNFAEDLFNLVNFTAFAESIRKLFR